MNGTQAMPKKLDRAQFFMPSVEARAIAWGRCIRAQRVAQRITARAFCPRILVSESTLRRMEKGDPAVAMGTYLTALCALGLLDLVVPMPKAEWTGMTSPHARARPVKGDDDYF